MFKIRNNYREGEALYAQDPELFLYEYIASYMNIFM